MNLKSITNLPGPRGGRGKNEKEREREKKKSSRKIYDSSKGTFLLFVAAAATAAARATDKISHLRPASLKLLFHAFFMKQEKSNYFQ